MFHKKVKFYVAGNSLFTSYLTSQGQLWGTDKEATNNHQLLLRLTSRSCIKVKSKSLAEWISQIQTTVSLLVYMWTSQYVEKSHNWSFLILIFLFLIVLINNATYLFFTKNILKPLAVELFWRTFFCNNTCRKAPIFWWFHFLVG